MTSRWDVERFGIGPMATPRQADVLLVTGYVSLKTLKELSEPMNKCQNLNGF